MSLNFNMRHQGRITIWHDDKGFGFITPNGDGKRVFAHIKAFSNKKRRPAGNELVTYELKTDSKGRLNAERIAFVGESASETTHSKPSGIPILLAVLFFLALGIATLIEKLPSTLFTLYFVASIVTLLAYKLDKSAAKNSHWRTKENTLHTLSLMGGWPGALIAQRLFRHKTKKASFQSVFWVTVVFNIGAFGWLLLSPSADNFRNIIGMK